MIISYYLPPITLSNLALSNLFPEKSEEDFLKNFGIKNRFIRQSHQIGSDLGYESAQLFFEEFDSVPKEKIDYLIFCTEGLDYKCPTSASVLHHRLGLKTECACLDMPMGCAGYIYGLSLAKSLVLSGVATHVLLIVADIPTSVIHSQDFDLRAIFSDAGATTLISKKEAECIGGFVFGSDGSGAKNLIVEHGSTRKPIDSEWIEKYKDEPEYLAHGRMTMNGLEIARFSLQRVPQLLEDVLAKNNLAFEEVDLFVFHQASKFILNALKRKLKIPDEKFYEYIEEVGNTVSCTIPIALKNAEKEGVLKEGMKVVLLGFGVGYSWGGTVIRWS